MDPTKRMGTLGPFAHHERRPRRRRRKTFEVDIERATGQQTIDGAAYMFAENLEADSRRFRDQMIEMESFYVAPWPEPKNNILVALFERFKQEILSAFGISTQHHIQEDNDDPRYSN